MNLTNNNTDNIHFPLKIYIKMYLKTIFGKLRFQHMFPHLKFSFLGLDKQSYNACGDVSIFHSAERGCVFQCQQRGMTQRQMMRNLIKR